MKHLILIRHAKSSWDVPMNDKDRPLALRGVQNAHLVATHAKTIFPKSFIVWSSTSRRTRETATIFAQNINFLEENIHYKDELYTFDGHELEEIIKKCENKYETLILFGHNEAITNIVNKFGDSYIENVPTTGLVSIVFNDNDWNKIKKGKITHQIFPKHLQNEHSNDKQIYR